MSKELLHKLIEKYESNRDHYITPEYNEAQLRTDFLNPFLKLLGWDIANEKGKSTNEREVLVEEPLKAEVKANTKKPDYTFRLFAERKYFLEAKKPNIKIETDSEPAKQIRRYGFTAKLKISVLSNFEYLAIYDCSQKINDSDTITKSRVKLYHYKEYEKAFDELKKIIGRASVYSGDFDTQWKHIEDQLKLFSVDSLFLKQINEWRLILGNEIYNHKSGLSNEELNDVTQSYINSIIFLRVCEDRYLEDYKTLLNFADAKDFQALIEKLYQADKKYNAGLFKHTFAEEIINNNNSAFWKIIKQLYYPENTYSFAVFASDILGNIYEIFLGEQLAIESGRVILVKKPENIDRDIITTPSYIIQAILRNTVLEYCKGKTDKQILESSFADIACGSGSFLLETYQLINDVLIDYYLKKSPEKLIQTAVGTYKLPFPIKRKILENCIYGVDKDYNAVEACKFGLLLKLLEEENNSTIPTPALPDLSSNIHFGNSLIDSSLTSADNQQAINPFDFGDNKFDVIVGNPPYLATEHMKQLTPLELPLYKRYYSSAFKQFDKYFLFIERAFSLLNTNGMFGYIVPSKFTKVGAGKKLRGLLKDKKCVQKVVSFGANQVFQDKTTYTCLLILTNKEQENLKYIEIKNLTDFQTRKITTQNYDEIVFDELDNDVWILVPGYLKQTFQSITNQSILLEDLIGADNIYNGIQTSANEIYIHTPTNDDGKYYYFEKDDKAWKIEKELTRPYFKTSGGTENLSTYRPFLPNAFVVYPYLKINDEIKFVEIEKLRTDYPCAYEYLMAYKDELNDATRDIQPVPRTSNEWYRYGRHQSLDKCDVPAKIIVGVLSQGDKYAIDYYGTLISSGGTAGYCIITLPNDCQYSIYYIQALLNSKYLEWFSSLIGEVFRGGYIARGTKVLKRLPIREIDFDDKQNKDMHNKIASIQERLIAIQKEIDINHGNQRQLTPLERDFHNKKEELDKTLKQLFNLGDDDNLIPLISEIYATD